MLWQMAKFHSLLWISNILMMEYHIYSHSSIDRHLGCFRILAIVNSGAVNIQVHVSSQLMFSFSSDKYSEVELLDHMAVLFLILFSIMAAPIYSPVTVREDLLFSTLLPVFDFCLFKNNHCDRCEVLSHCGSDLYFVQISDVEHLFVYLLIIYMSSL